VEEMEVLGKKESRKTKENWERYNRNLGLIGVDESVALDRGRWRKIIASPTPT